MAPDDWPPVTEIVGRCEHCGHVVDRVGADRPGVPAPRDGDVCVCISCAGLMAYDGDGGLRSLTRAELTEVIDDPDIVELQRQVRRLHGGRA